MSDAEAVPITFPLHPLLQRAMQAGAALRERNRQLWHMGKQAPDWRFSRTPWGQWRLPSPFKTSLRWIAEMNDRALAEVEFRDLQALDQSVELLLTQAGLVFDFGEAVGALNAQQAHHGPDLSAAMSTLREEWPDSYLRFVADLTRSIRREDLERWDGDQTQLAILATVPPELASALLNRVQRKLSLTGRDDKMALVQQTNIAPDVLAGIGGHVNRLYDLHDNCNPSTCRGASIFRLDLWRQIAHRFTLEQVDRPGLDEGKLACLMKCPRAVARALLPSAPVLSHVALLEICSEARVGWSDLVDDMRRKLRPRRKKLAREAIEKSLHHMEQEASATVMAIPATATAPH